VKPPTTKKKGATSDLESDCVVLERGNVLARAASMEDQRIFAGRPGGTKAAKKDQRQTMVREATLFAQAKATK
jgi:hypothetical protein